MVFSIQLLIGTYNTVPIGTSQDELEEIYQSRLRPYLKALYRHPRVKCVLYYSGSLLGWIEKNHSEFIDVLQEMVKRRQIELLGGGYYEPAFSMISRTDSIGQIELLTTYLRRLFGGRPRGCWIPEMIWEPSYPSLFRAAGLEFTFLDQAQFVDAGYLDTDLLYPTYTEDQGKILTILPVIDSLCRPSISGTHFQQQLLELKSKVEPEVRAKGEPTVSCLWDGTLGSESGLPLEFEEWLDGFFGQIRELQEAGHCITRLPSRLLRIPGSFSKGYLGATSYHSLLQRLGVSPQELEAYSKKYLPGIGRWGYYYRGTFRQSLARYPEASALYGKMQFTNILVNQIRGDKYRKQAAKEELWKGQSHSPLWYGPRGGIYQSSLRKHAYSALIAAELMTREQGIFAPSIVKSDLDLDGLDEYLYQGSDLNAYVHSRGGVLFELDYLKQPWNYLDTFGRYPEPQHREDTEKNGQDLVPRRSFVDHFYHPKAGSTCSTQTDQGTHWNSPYRLEDRTTDVAKILHLHLVHEGVVTNQQGIQVAIEIRKSYSFEKGKITLGYTLTNNSSEELEIDFCPEVNLSFASLLPSDFRMFSLSTPAVKTELPTQVESISRGLGVLFEDYRNKVGLRLEFERSIHCEICPVFTTYTWRGTSITEYQSTALFFRIPLKLVPGQVWQKSLSLRLTRLR